MTAEKFHDALTLLPADLVAEADKKRSGKPKILPWKRYAAMAACFALVLCSGWFCMRLFGPKGATESRKEAAAEAAVMQAAENRSDIAIAIETEAAAYEEAAPAAVENGLAALPTVTAKEESAAEDMQTDTASGSAVMGTLYAGMSQPKYVNTPPNLSGSACFVTPSPRLIQSRADLDAYLNKTPSQFLLDELVEACTGYDDIWFEIHDLLLIPLCTVAADDLPAVTAIREQDGQWYICIANSPQSYPEDAQPEYTDLHILIEVEKGLISSKDAITLIFE